MKREIVALVTTGVLALGGSVVGATSAQAASCSLYLHGAANTPGYAMVTNYSCSQAKAWMVYQNPATGRKTTTSSPIAWAGQTQKTGTVTASWVVDRFYTVVV